MPSRAVRTLTKRAEWLIGRLHRSLQVLCCNAHLCCLPDFPRPEVWLSLQITDFCLQQRMLCLARKAECLQTEPPPGLGPSGEGLSHTKNGIGSFCWVTLSGSSPFSSLYTKAQPRGTSDPSK